MNNFKDYRNNLADQIRNTPKEERGSVLAEAKATDDYQIEKKKYREARQKNITQADKYGPEAIKNEITLKVEKIKDWLDKNKFTEDKDYKIITGIKDIELDAKSVAPHELRQFFVLIQEDKYKEFEKYVLGDYSKWRKEVNPNNKYGGPTLDYSWGGRYAVINDGVFFDTAPALNLEKGNVSATTHHDEFKKFFKEKAGFDFPTSKDLNPILQEMSKNGLKKYEEVLAKLKNIREEGGFKEGDWALVDEVERATMILRDAKEENGKIGEAVVDLPELLTGNMPAKMRHYADLTYNAEDIHLDWNRIKELTSIDILQGERIDNIFDKHGFDRNRMEDICMEFSDKLTKDKEMGRVRQELNNPN
ncbi:MAG: hypothetical protein WC523_05215 [Patescibacteria group bacterium]|jgi:hypothetical protein